MRWFPLIPVGVATCVSACAMWGTASLPENSPALTTKEATTARVNANATNTAVIQSGAPEEPPPKTPEGLNPDRALPGSEPQWWVKADKPSVDVKTHVLENGLTVLLLKHGAVPIAASYLQYDVGSMNETAGITGVAHYLEHMMFKGSKKYARGDIDKTTVKHGGSNNAYTSYDVTAYHFVIPVAGLPSVLDIEADRMSALALEQSEFDLEKKVVQEESNRAYDNPQDRFWEDLMRARFGDDHPYSHPVLGFPKDVAGMSVSEMRAFHEKYYTPDNAVLCVVGDIDPAAALELIKNKFGAIPRSRYARPEVKATIPKPQAQRRFVRFAEVQTARAAITLPGDSSFCIRGPIRDVLASVLAMGENSRLYKRLVEGEKLCDSVNAGDFSQKLGGVFSIDLSMKAGMTETENERAVAIVFEELAKIAKEPPAADEVARGVRAAEVAQAFGMEATAGLADRLAYYQRTYGDWRYIDHYLETLRRVTPDDVRQVSDDWNLATDVIVGWLLPKERKTGDTEPVKTAPMPKLDVREVVLENGLRLLMLPQDSGPHVCTLRAVYEAGKRTEPSERNGLTALFGATMEAGTASRTRQQIAAIFDANGGSFSAGSSGITASVLSGDLLASVDVVADVLQNSTFPEDQVELERQHLLSDIKRLSENHNSMARRAFDRALYGKEHPFGTATAVAEQIMQSITRKELLAHYKGYVAPNNTRIICVGRFDPKELEAGVRSKLGDWAPAAGATGRRSGAIPSRDKPQGELKLGHDKFSEEAVVGQPSTILIDHPEKSQCHILVGNIGVKRDHPDYYALLVMDSILGTSPAFTDRFSSILRDQMGLAYSTWANIGNNSSEEPGAFLGYIGTRPESVPQALEGMRKLLTQIRTEEVTDAELECAKNYLTKQYFFSLEGSANLAGLISTIDRYQLGWDYLQTYATRVLAVTKADVLRVAKTHLLPPERMVTVISGPMAKIPSVAQPGLVMPPEGLAKITPGGVKPPDGPKSGG